METRLEVVYLSTLSKYWVGSEWRRGMSEQEEGGGLTLCYWISLVVNLIGDDYEDAGKWEPPLGYEPTNIIICRVRRGDGGRGTRSLGGGLLLHSTHGHSLQEIHAQTRINLLTFRHCQPSSPFYKQFNWFSLLISLDLQMCYRSMQFFHKSVVEDRKCAAELFSGLS